LTRKGLCGRICSMNEHNLPKEEMLEIIRQVDEDPSINQRVLSDRLNISLGKTNYMLRELAKKGIIKIASFSANPDKARKMRYILTQKGFREKVNLTYHFLRAKEKEYKRLKTEYEKYKNISSHKEKDKTLSLRGGNNVDR